MTKDEYLEWLKNNPMTCPFKCKDNPLTEYDATLFCNDGCSVDCSKLMIEWMERRK